MVHQGRQVNSMATRTTPRTASFAALGDVVIAEPKALIGFAGPNVVRETIKEELPDGFQSAEFFLERGFIDLVVSRSDLRSRLISILSYAV